MSRTTPPTRMDDLAKAARHVFRTKGYRATLVADVAAEVGLSPAAVYRHVESKEALFHLCFLPTDPADPAAIGPADFLATPTAEETVAVVGQRLRAMGGLPQLRAALRAPAPPADRAAVATELAGIITEQFVLVAANNELLALVEACAVDRPDIRTEWFQRRRGRATRDLTRYLCQRADDGLLRTVPDPDVAAMLIREAIAWFARHGRGDPGQALDDERSLRTIVDVLVHGFLP